MSIEVLSIIVLGIMFIIASLLPINLGVLGFVASFIIGSLVSGMDVKEIYGVFPADLFITLAGVTYMFAIVQKNGTIDMLTNWSLRLVRGNLGMVPWILFAISTLLTSIGTFGPATVAILAPIAMRFAAQYNISPLLIGVFVVQGSAAGSYSPINAVGVIVNGILESKNLPQSPFGLFMNSLVFSILMLVVVFVAFGGLRLMKSQMNTQVLVSATAEVDVSTGNKNGLTWYKGATITGILLLILLSLVFQVNIGFAAFAIGLTLALLSPKENSGVLTAMPWSVILLITGVVTYVGVLDTIGTVDYVTHIIAEVGNPVTASLAASYVGGVVSSFASTAGILAAIIPLAAPILQDPSVSAIGVISSIAISSIIVDLSPFSTNGALLLANAQGLNERSFFKQLLLWAGAVVAFGPGLAWLLFVVIGVPW
jgi:Na+/H+ antiporter NhaD/arsenite permease-like protein